MLRLENRTYHLLPFNLLSTKERSDHQTSLSDTLPMSRVRAGSRSRRRKKKPTVTSTSRWALRNFAAFFGFLSEETGLTAIKEPWLVCRACVLKASNLTCFCMHSSDFFNQDRTKAITEKGRKNNFFFFLNLDL